jgi:hypothetical protein
MRKIAMWIIWNVPVGFLAPHIFAFAIGCKKNRRIAPQDTKEAEHE